MLFNALVSVAKNERPPNADRNEQSKEQKPVEGVHSFCEWLLKPIFEVRPNDHLKPF